MKICIFEDSMISGLYPVNLLRHSSDILCGVFSLREKIENILQRSIFTIHSRKKFIPLYKEIHRDANVNSFGADDYLFLNSRIIYTKSLLEGLQLTLDEIKDRIILHNDNIIAFIISRSKIPQLNRIINTGDGLISVKNIKPLNLKPVQLSQISAEEIDELKIISSPADLILFHNEEILNDLEILFSRKKNERKHRTSAEMINPAKIHIEQNCKINRSVVLDATGGPIYISKNSEIEPFTYIKGPVYIGENSLIRSGSRLYGPLRIGNNCKISGEITCSIFHSFVNKQHLGFIGHSYICEWVNLGAGTTTSNLKNNYSRISIQVNKNKINTNSIFLGSIIGDHTKTGISTMLNSGTIIGISSNLFGGGFHSKFLNSFSWADTGDKIKRYELDKALNTAKISMGRRNIKMSREYEAIFKSYF